MNPMFSKSLLSRFKVFAMGAGSVLNVSGRQALPPIQCASVHQNFYWVGRDFNVVLQRETGKSVSENVAHIRGQGLLNLNDV